MKWSRPGRVEEGLVAMPPVGEEPTMAQQVGAALERIVVPLDGSALAEQALLYAHAVGDDDAELVLVAGPPG
jgi:hypothetical protein